MIQDNSKSVNLLRTIKVANVLLMCYVNTFLDQALIRNNKFKANYELFDVEEIINEMAQSLKP